MAIIIFLIVLMMRTMTTGLATKKWERKGCLIEMGSATMSHWLHAFDSNVDDNDPDSKLSSPEFVPIPTCSPKASAYVSDVSYEMVILWTSAKTTAWTYAPSRKNRF